ncbi:hypothetical protein GJ744_002637 [Endocarpon pusillum]|uniref:NADH-ubiquinone oxidoreductase 21.3 kDa subunit n=1 Tax=Endocarpon pusillum TaxID=364733 RepID=A0A8H7A7V3_9EURO|nr:hypothetical protein GJ744_002637 [Endocarpon pusillum]
MAEQKAYQPKDTIQAAAKATLYTGSAGLLFAAVQNTLTRQNIGALGVFTRFGGSIGLFAGVGGTYAFISTASANLREKNDPYNQALGGFCAGALLGVPKRQMSSVIGRGVLVAITLAAASYTGNSMLSETVDTDTDRFLSKSEIRNRFRRPVNELINEIGEGRGIYGPGYEERRRQRIKENYGIDVPEPYYKKP